MARAPSKPPSNAARVLILHGTDRFQMDGHLSALREALAAEHGAGGVDTVRFDGAQGQRILADVLDECRSGGLMRQFKIVLVDNADLLVKVSEEGAAPAAPGPRGRGVKSRRAYVPKSAREVLEAYAGAPSDSAVLVLRAQTWRPGNLDKAVARVGAVIKCEPPGAAEAARMAQDMARSRHQTSIDARAAAMLVDAVGTDLGRIDTELEKLALAAGGDGKPITSALVQSMTGLTREEEFWAIQSALLTGDAGAALAQLRELLEVSRHDPVPITFAYVEMARKVHLAARGLAEGVAPARIIPGLKVFGYGPERDQLVASVMNTARAAGPGRAAELFDAALATDAANKSGLGDPVRNLERLTVRFADLARSGSAARR